MMSKSRYRGSHVPVFIPRQHANVGPTLNNGCPFRWPNVDIQRWPNVCLLVGSSLGQHVGITLGQRMSMLITMLGQR